MKSRVLLVRALSERSIWEWLKAQIKELLSNVSPKRTDLQEKYIISNLKQIY